MRERKKKESRTEETIGQLKSLILSRKEAKKKRSADLIQHLAATIGDISNLKKSNLNNSFS